jgi:hypothetical protein
MTFSYKILAATLMVSVASPAFGQEATLPREEVGRVKALEGPAGSAVVFRGASAYSLAVGDVLFRGDRVLTRAEGATVLALSGCERRLDGVASITLDKAVCSVDLLTFAEAGAVVAVAGSEAAAAFAPTLTPLLGLAGVGSLVAVDGPFN